MTSKLPWIAAALLLLLATAYLFGKRIASMIDDSIGLWPTPGYRRITSKFGPRTAPTAGASSMHKGIDIATPIGTTVIAPWDGKVVVANTHPTGGIQLVIQHDNGKRTGYAHLSSRLVDVGDVVKRGQAIARTGSTGASTGPHLHFSMRPTSTADHIDPTPHIA